LYTIDKAMGSTLPKVMRFSRSAIYAYGCIVVLQEDHTLTMHERVADKLIEIGVLSTECNGTSPKGNMLEVDEGKNNAVCDFGHGAPSATRIHVSRTTMHEIREHLISDEVWKQEPIGSTIKFSRHNGRQQVRVRENYIYFIEKGTVLGSFNGDLGYLPVNKIEMRGDLLCVNNSRFWFSWPATVVSDPYLPSAKAISIIGTRLPLELHSIIGTYVGNEHITWSAAGEIGMPDAVKMYLDNHAHIIDYGNYLRVQCATKALGFDMTGWSMFENHLVILHVDKVFVVDLNDFKDGYTSTTVRSGHLTCGPSSFKIDDTYYSYERATPIVAEPWEVQSSMLVMNIQRRHYIVRNLSYAVEMAHCPLCANTCISMDGIHVPVPAFGKCSVHMHRIGTRMTIVMVGTRGIHFQIHDTPRMGAPQRLAYDTDTTHKFPEFVPFILFTGAAITLKDVAGKWVTYSMNDIFFPPGEPHGGRSPRRPPTPGPALGPAPAPSSCAHQVLCGGRIFLSLWPQLGGPELPRFEYIICVKREMKFIYIAILLVSTVRAICIGSTCDAQTYIDRGNARDTHPFLTAYGQAFGHQMYKPNIQPPQFERYNQIRRRSNTAIVGSSVFSPGSAALPLAETG